MQQRGAEVEPYLSLQKAAVPLGRNGTVIFEPTTDLRRNGHGERSVEPREVVVARFPLTDFHNHLGRWGNNGNWAMEQDRIRSFVDRMDMQHIQMVVNLDGTLETLEENLRRYDRPYPGHFLTIFNIDGRNIAAILREPNFGEILSSQLIEARELGAKGLKIHKTLGMEYRNGDGQLIPVDDERLQPLWETAADLGMPVVIHTADPPEFWDPVTPQNPSYQQLIRHPEWQYYGKDYPPYAVLMAQRNRLAAKNPDTIFIYAHVGEDIAGAVDLLDTYPNVYVDTGARFAEFGMHEEDARALFAKHPDRVIFGLDNGGNGDGPQIADYSPPLRYLQTEDTDFPYAAEGEEQYDHGNQTINGINLPDETLQMVYSGNARSLLSIV